MNPDKTQFTREGVDKSVFRKLRIRYIIGLSAIAITIIICENLIKSNLQEQLHDSRVVNVAGRQRMLSQKITKIALLIEREKNASSKRKLSRELTSTLHLWVISYNGLLWGSDSLGLPHWQSSAIDSMYANINPHYEKIVKSANQIISSIASPLYGNNPNITENVDSILKHESQFLDGMDMIVFRYADEARTKVDKVIREERLLLVTSLLILLFELIFIFAPVAKNIRKIIAELLSNEAKEKQMNAKLILLNQTIERSQKELESIYYAVDRAIMFARTDLDGNLLFISDKLVDQLGLVLPKFQPNLFNILQSNELKDAALETVLQSILQGEMWKNEIQVLNANKLVIWLNMTIVPVVDSQNEITQLVVVCVDINERKIAQDLLQKATKEKYQHKVAQEKLKSSFILEGQEKERRRIAREIHDGIGQLLTGLKFQLESINGVQNEKNIRKIDDSKELISSIIREVRRVSYNLTPSGLNDYGFVPALQTLVKGFNGLSSTQVKLDNKTGFDTRLEKKTELNLFRIIQEALNNALKYAKADNILISLAHENNLLMIVIEDDGVGFNLKNVMVKEVDKMAGHGLLNMKERAGFIHATFNITASPGSGTIIKIELPI